MSVVQVDEDVDVVRISPAMRRMTRRLARPQKLPTRSGWRRRALKKFWPLYVMMMPPLVFLVVFNFWPILGAQIAFRDYNPVGGIWGSPWVGLEQFQQWVSNPQFLTIMSNTLILSFYQLIVSTPITIILALALNEVRLRWFQKFIQTVTYFPHFISIIVLIGMMQLVFSPDNGPISHLLAGMGIQMPDVFGSAGAFRHLYVWSGVWQTTGYGAIIYLGVLSSVSPALYEAAKLDGASLLQKIRHVDLPAIKPTIVILVILDMGNLLQVGFEKVFLLQNPLNLSTSQVISTYVYQTGLVSGNFSFGTAVGLFNSVISLILIIVANFVARRVSDTSLF